MWRFSPGDSPVDSHCNNAGVLTAPPLDHHWLLMISVWVILSFMGPQSDVTDPSSITSHLHFTDTKTPPKPKAVKSEPRTPGPDAPSTKKVWIYVPNAQFTDSQNHIHPLAARSLFLRLQLVTQDSKLKFLMWVFTVCSQVKKSESVHSNGQTKAKTSQLLEPKSDKVSQQLLVRFYKVLVFPEDREQLWQQLHLNLC